MEIISITEKPELISQVSKYHLETFQQFFLDNHQIKDITELEILYRKLYLEERLGELFILYDLQKLIGFVSLNPDNITNYQRPKENGIFITDIYILESYRGLGYGTFLLKRMIHKLLIMNKSIYVSIYKEKLFSYYEKMGFEKVDSVLLNQKKYLIYEFVDYVKY